MQSVQHSSQPADRGAGAILLVLFATAAALAAANTTVVPVIVVVVVAIVFQASGRGGTSDARRSARQSWWSTHIVSDDPWYAWADRQAMRASARTERRRRSPYANGSAS